MLTAVLLGLWPAVAAAQGKVRVVNDEARGEIVLLIGPVDLPNMGEHHGGEHGALLPPVETVTLPIDGYFYGFRFDAVDAAGNPVPPSIVHHLNFIDPDRRELFLPISQRISAAGGETAGQTAPWLLFGMPVSAGQRVVVSAMLHNPTGKEWRGVTVRFYWKYVKAGRLWPFFQFQPFQLDVAFPAGDKSWDLPPGPSSRSYEGKPSVPGRVMAIGGHLHPHATSLTFEDVTAGRLIWEGKPTVENGVENRLAIGYLYRKLGARMDTSHVYRVTVNYVNPTGDTLRSGGMGVVAGAFMPSGNVPWPATDTTDALYALDRKHYLREVRGTMAAILSEGKDQKTPAKAPAPPHRHD